MRRAIALLLVGVVLNACQSTTPSDTAAQAVASDAAVATSTSSSTTATTATTATTTTTTSATPASTASPSPATALPLNDFSARPFTVEVPAGYDPSVPAPLLVVLHGYTSSGPAVKEYFNLQSLAEERGFLAVYPDGTVDGRGQPFWNATDACCNFFNVGTGDSGYLMGIVNDVKGRYSVDSKRIYFLGHSNGGFMSYRMACDHADMVAAIVSVAGATFTDTNACQPSEPVSVLQIHGTTDQVISYSGGAILGKTFPGASGSASTWAAYNGCATKPVVTAEQFSLDLVVDLPDNDTSVSTYTGCRNGTHVVLDSIEGGLHSPAFSADFPEAVLDFLYAHPKV